MGGAVDLNADLGEGMGADRELLEVVTSANVAAGAHAGGGEILVETVALACERGVRVGAHPSYRDREHFGRRSQLGALRTRAEAVGELASDLVSQILAVAGETARHGVRLAHVKAHGALYNDAVADELAAQLVVGAVRRAEVELGYRLPIVTLPHGRLSEAAAAADLQVIGEGFVDRAYTPQGTLVPRSQSGAVLHDLPAMLANAAALVAPGGPPGVRTLCVHGDNPRALAAARAVRDELAGDGWQVTAPSQGPGAAGAADLAGVEVREFGDRCWLVGCEPGQVVELLARARAAFPAAGAIAGLDSVLLEFADPASRPHAAAVAGAIASPATRGAAPAARVHHVAVRYDGEDLAELCASTRLSPAELIARHQAASWQVAAVGFAPGFGYLRCPDSIFARVARRADPRPRVPAGSVALAAGMCAVYPAATPGGWQLLGTTDVELFDPAMDEPALLRVGDLVVFQVAAQP